MQTDILTIVERFAADANLSDYRAGMVLAKNGRLLERLRNSKRGIWPDTELAIRNAIERERDKRGLNAHIPAHGLGSAAAQPRGKNKSAARARAAG